MPDRASTSSANPPGAAIHIPLPDEQPLLDFHQVPVMLGIGRTLAYHLARDGQFPIEVIYLGRNMKVRTADVRRYLGLDAGSAA